MNSLLQGLSSCPSFIRWLEEFTAQYRTEQGKSQEHHQCLSVTLLQLLRGTETFSCCGKPRIKYLKRNVVILSLFSQRKKLVAFEFPVLVPSVIFNPMAKAQPPFTEGLNSTDSRNLEFYFLKKVANNLSSFCFSPPKLTVFPKIWDYSTTFCKIVGKKKLKILSSR